MVSSHQGLGRMLAQSTENQDPLNPQITQIAQITRTKPCIRDSVSPEGPDLTESRMLLLNWKDQNLSAVLLGSDHRSDPINCPFVFFVIFVVQSFDFQISVICAICGSKAFDFVALSQTSRHFLYFTSPPTSHVSTMAMITASHGRRSVASVCRAELPEA